MAGRRTKEAGGEPSLGSCAKDQPAVSGMDESDIVCRFRGMCERVNARRGYRPAYDLDRPASSLKGDGSLSEHWPAETDLAVGRRGLKRRNSPLAQAKATSSGAVAAASQQKRSSQSIGNGSQGRTRLG